MMGFPTTFHFLEEINQIPESLNYRHYNITNGAISFNRLYGG